MGHYSTVSKMQSSDADPPPGDHHLAAGPFSSWLGELQAARRAEGDADVPCGTCTACCTSSQFVHIAPDEHQTLARIPTELLFPAPRAPAGHVLLGYDERGHCPMLIDHACSIYEDRPRTCRTYDCRVFAAAGIELTQSDKAQIADRVRQWQFSYPGRSDRVEHEAIMAASAFLTTHPALLPTGTPDTQVALLALDIHDLFVSGEMPVVTTDPTNLEVLIDRLQRLTDRP
jgi:Fe-S-cluster containining protein